MTTFSFQCLSLLLLGTALGGPPAPVDDEYAIKLETISLDYGQLGNSPEISDLVKLDQGLRELVPVIAKIETSGGKSYYRGEYEKLGLSRNHWSGNLEYSGALLKLAHKLDPNSMYRNQTLYSEIEIDYSRSGLPGIDAAHRYVFEFPDGPFIANVYEILATFYDDLNKSVRGEIANDPEDNHELYRECYQPYFSALPIESQVAQARTLSVLFYEKAIEKYAANDEKVQLLKSYLESVRNGTNKYWFWCSAC